MTETELKLALDPAAGAKLARSAALEKRARRRRLTSIYFDTPDTVLAKHRMALRLRRSGRRWTQCLKAGTSGTGGLHARDEWELERPGPTLDLSLFAGTPLARLEGAEALHAKLLPVFEVDVVRTTWDVEPAPGHRLEVAWDAGTVRSGERRDAISEVEIECVEAPASAAFELAERLLDDVALRPSPTTKAQRGYRLYRGKVPRPVKAARPRVEAAMTPLEGARALIAAGLAQLQANEEGVLASDDPEFVHQARVAMRRMRSTLRMFRRVVGRKQANAWRDALGEMGRALGAARDWDVFATETLPGLVRDFAKPRTAKTLAIRAARRRAAAREAAREALRSGSYGRVILEISRWLAEDAAAAVGTLEDFAARLLRKRHKRLAAGAARLRGLDAAGRHRVRIDAKRLRYVADGLGNVFSEEKVRPYVDCLADLQDALGKANDAATAIELLGALAPPRDFAAKARGRLRLRMRSGGARLEKIAERIASRGHFW
jgi:inorganic triphosphatase YgiF